MRLARLSIIFFSSAFFGAAVCVSAGADEAGVIVTTGAAVVLLLAGALTWTSALAAAWLAAASANDVGTVRRVVSSGAVVPAAQAVVPARDKSAQSVTAICFNTIVPPNSAAPMPRGGYTPILCRTGTGRYPSVNAGTDADDVKILHIKGQLFAACAIVYVQRFIVKIINMIGRPVYTG